MKIDNLLKDIKNTDMFEEINDHAKRLNELSETLEFFLSIADRNKNEKEIMKKKHSIVTSLVYRKIYGIILSNNICDPLQGLNLDDYFSEEESTKIRGTRCCG